MKDTAGIRMSDSDATRRQVFVAYSYGLYPGPEFRQVFDRVGMKTGTAFIFADTRLTNEHILDKITRMIHEADYSVFDISDWNPNVTLELGIARESGRPWYITIDPSRSTGGIREAPADLRGFDRIQYSSFDELERGLIRLESGQDSSRRQEGGGLRGLVPSKVFDRVVDVEATAHFAIEIEAPKGARISVFAREMWRQAFDLYLMDRKNYASFFRDRSGREFYGVTDEPVIEFERKVPRAGGWYIVIDAFNKVNNRRVALEVTVKPPPR